MNTQQSGTHALPSTPTTNAAAPSLARCGPRARAGEGGAASASPGVITSGESSLVEGPPENGESFELCNRGGRATFIAHPQPHPMVPGHSAITDYLNCTFPFDACVQSVTDFLLPFGEVVGAAFFPMKDRRKGFNGYEQSYDLGQFGAKFACVGQRGTAMLCIPGKACATIPDWPRLVEFLRDTWHARITRWDGAVDDYVGEHSVDWAVERYLAGDFGTGGNRPSSRQNGNWIEPDGSGRTLYIGKAKNGKMLRVYEKGMQCGTPWHPWVRWEVELHNVDRVVPWEALLEPGRYLAGAYPKALGWVQEEMSRIRTLREEEALAYQHLANCAATAYGPLINVMMEVEGTADKVVEKLRRPGAPARLQLPIRKWWE